MRSIRNSQQHLWLAALAGTLVCLLAGCGGGGGTDSLAVTSAEDTSVATSSKGSAASDVSSKYTYSATYKLSGGTASFTGKTVTASTTDTSGVWVTNNGVLTLIRPTVTTSGNTSSNDDSSFYGLNAGVLAAVGRITLSGGHVTTTGTGANGIFATGSGASVTVRGTVVDCTGDGGHAVMCTQGGVMKCTNVNMVTRGKNSGAIATDRGSGIILVSGGTVATSGADSPGIYSTGVIKVENATISATGSEAAVIEGANSIKCTNTALAGTLKRGVMIYQSMSGDAEGTQGKFTMVGGSLSAAAGPLFYVTNSTGIIRLVGVTCTASSGTILQAAAGDWGTSGSNGGTAVLSTSGQTLVGNLVCDNISSVTATLTKKSTLRGSITGAALTLDSSSKWIVTANSTLTTLSTPQISGTTISNIYGHGYTVTYDASLAGNSALGGLTYTLNGGGTLTPA